jgi:redox-sensitive bicupin YhaK (pirin superfamily)
VIRTVSHSTLGGFTGPGIVVRDHFRMTPENQGGPHYRLGPLRTLADTTIETGCGFPMHAHRDMEIVSYVCEGTLAHEDTLGNRGRLGPGDVQVMTTGTGIMHSEINAGGGMVRMYQLWILPDTPGLTPGYVDSIQPKAASGEGLAVLASGMSARPGGVPIHQDAAVLGMDLAAGESVTVELAPGRQAYVLAAHGRVSVEGIELALRDGAVVDGVESFRIAALDDSDVLVVDVPH